MPNSTTLNLSSIKSKINNAVSKAIDKDFILIDKKLEWATAHRLAVYLEGLFPEWNVDCEYNKMTQEYITKHNSDGKYKRPDIVIHKRGEISKRYNLIVIEIKMDNDQDNDLDKLKDFTKEPNGNRPFQYQYGLKISFNNTSLKWFSNGEEI